MLKFVKLEKDRALFENDAGQNLLLDKDMIKKDYQYKSSRNMDTSQLEKAWVALGGTI